MRMIGMIALSLLLAVLFAAPALAAAPLDAAAVRAAQDYGRSKAAVPMTDFLQPWTVYEEKAARLDDTAERACLFTPFLLIAADARDRTAAGGGVVAADAARVLADYKDYVVFEVTLLGNRADLGDRFTAILRQGRRTTGPSFVQIRQPAGALTAGQVRVFFYFPSRKVNTSQAATLTVTAAGKPERSFRIPFVGLR